VKVLLEHVGEMRIATTNSSIYLGMGGYMDDLLGCWVISWEYG
jgi:hypothetical protein